MNRPVSTISIDAQPESVTLDPSATALIVVDMQNDFGSPGGMFDRAGIDTSGIRAVIPATRRVIDAARSLGIKVVYLKMGFLPDLSDAGPEDAPNRIVHTRLGVGGERGALVRDTWGTEIVDELAPGAGDVVMYKSRYSGFYGTDLDDVLRSWSVRHLLVTGCTTSVCVESTVRDAFFRDYHCVVLADCCAEPIGADAPRTNHEASLLVMQLLFGSVSSSDRVIAAQDGSFRTT